MKPLILQYCKRSEGHLGGVPKFGMYLQRALGGDIISWRDYPYGKQFYDKNEVEHAFLLGAHVRAAGWLERYDFAVCDGFWANGLPQDFPVIVVCHGTWAEMNKQCGDVPKEYIKAQERAFREHPVVAVSDGAALQLWEHHGVIPVAVINNGVDLTEYYPAERSERNPRPLVLHVSNSRGKGVDIVEKVRWILPDVDIQYTDAGMGQEAERFRQGSMFLFPSRHEGDSYALIEAMACGLPILASGVGRLEGKEGSEYGLHVLPKDATAYEYASRLTTILRHETAGIRHTSALLRTLDYNRFAEEWRAVVERIIV